MLSIENPLPDPQLKTNDSTDERASDKQPVVDLLNPLPNFCIRNYVFDARRKDIKTNWPFSQKNLQLCLKHGVTDLLPPFQSLDSVRNRSSIQQCADQNISNDIETIHSCDGELPRSKNDHFSSVSCGDIGFDQNLAGDYEDLHSSEHQGPKESDKEFPSTITSQSCSEIDSVPTVKNPCLEPLADTFPGSSEFKPEAATPVSNDTQNTTENPVKKCRLIVRLSNITEPKSNEDSAANTSVSETMASKVCPVCKTFSSSSNTTLNAHIDQCLSGESTVKWTGDSKVIKHRIKPRKTRLMVDIYATARNCTLEELDRRNGTNWALNMGFPAQDVERESHTEERDKVSSPASLENTTNEEGAVYIDANGTKLRILSKFSDISTLSNVRDDGGPKKLMKGDKGGKVCSHKKKKKKKKKKNHVPKHSKLLKSAPHGQNSYHPRRNDFTEVQERNFPPDESHEREGFLKQPLKAQEKTGVTKLGVIKQWVGSKRTGLVKKVSNRDEYQNSKSVANDLSIENHPSPQAKRISSLNSPNLSDIDPFPSPQSSGKREDFPYGARNRHKESSLRKRTSLSFLESQDRHCKKKSAGLGTDNLKQTISDVSSVQDCRTDPPNCLESREPWFNEGLEIYPDQAKHADGILRSEKLSTSHVLSSEGQRFSSMRKSIPTGEVLGSGSKFNLKRNLSGLKKRRLRYKYGSDEEAVASRTATDEFHELEEKWGDTQEGSASDKISDKIGVVDSRETSGMMMTSWEEEANAWKGDNVGNRNASSFICSRDFGGTPDVQELAQEEVKDHEKDTVGLPESEMADGGDFMVFGKSLDPVDPELTVLVRGGIFGAEGGGDPDSHQEQGNYFLDVDTIPIPGPPGSFLPSPGRMGSEDLQGNSSLTTCRVQSSGENHELVDMDSSNSPVSATTSISNSNPTRSDSVEKSVGPHVVQNEVRSNASLDHTMESSCPFASGTGIEEGNLNLGESNISVVFPDKGHQRFNENQPCCCLRKEGASQAVSLNYQDSQLLHRRNVGSIPSPHHEMPMPCDPGRNLRSEMLYTGNKSLEAEKDVPRSPMSCIPMEVSVDSEVKFGNCGDYGSTGSSTTNPILRLMGKNLMVINKDVGAIPQSRLGHPSLVNDQAHMQSFAVNTVPTFRTQSEQRSSLYVASRGPIFDHSNLRSSHPSLGMPSRNLLVEQHGSKGLADSVAYDIEKVLLPYVPQPRTPNPSPSTPKEIIVIDDSPESEALPTAETCSRGNMKTGVSSTGISASVIPSYDSSNTNPFYSCNAFGFSISSGSPMVSNTSFQAPTLKGVNVNPVKWNCTPEGSSIVQPNSLTRSTMRYSPGFL